MQSSRVLKLGHKIGRPAKHNAIRSQSQAFQIKVSYLWERHNLTRVEIIGRGDHN